MSTPKPRIRPKCDPHPQRSASRTRDPPSYPDVDPRVFTEEDPGMEQKATERVLFQEDDCLR